MCMSLLYIHNSYLFISSFTANSINQYGLSLPPQLRGWSFKILPATPLPTSISMPVPYPLMKYPPRLVWPLSNFVGGSDVLSGLREQDKEFQRRHEVSRSVSSDLSLLLRWKQPGDLCQTTHQISYTEGTLASQFPGRKTQTTPGVCPSSSSDTQQKSGQSAFQVTSEPRAKPSWCDFLSPDPVCSVCLCA